MASDRRKVKMVKKQLQAVNGIFVPDRIVTVWFYDTQAHFMSAAAAAAAASAVSACGARRQPEPVYGLEHMDGIVRAQHKLSGFIARV